MRLPKPTIYILFLLALFFHASWVNAADDKSPNAFDTAMAAYAKKDYVTALMMWFPLAEAGDKDAQFMLGKMYLEQEGNGRDPGKAVYWYQRAANLGHHEAQTSLGMLYLNGDVIEKNSQLAAKYLLLATRNEYAHSRSASVVQQELEQIKSNESRDFKKGMIAYDKQDYATALMLWLPLTTTGNADALYMLGRMYMEQTGERRNPLKAEYWFKRAAEQGHAEAQMTLGLMYFTGKDISKNLSLAAKWLLKASNNESKPAKATGKSSSSIAKGKKKEQSPFNKGMIAYQNKDYVSALMLWHPLALEGNTDAQLMLGNLYMREEGIYKDPTLGMVWYDKAIAQNDTKTTKALGLMYLYGDDIKKNSGRALDLLHKAARQGDVESQYMLANIYFNGKVTQQNLPKAGYWYQQAATKKHTEAQYALGNMYLQGYGINKDVNQAISLFKKAERSNHLNATLALANIYFEDVDKPKDLKKSFGLFEKAARLGSAEAQYQLGNFYMEGEGVTRDHKQAFSWYEKSAEQDYVEGVYNLGKMYVNGYGVSVDYKKGVELFMKAAKQGHGMAQLDLGAAYFNGKGIVYDSAEAYAWFYMASLKGVDTAYTYKSKVYNALQIEDKKRADQLAEKYMKLYK